MRSTRREFMKLGAAASVGLAVPETAWAQAAPRVSLGMYGLCMVVIGSAAASGTPSAADVDILFLADAGHTTRLQLPGGSGIKRRRHVVFDAGGSNATIISGVRPVASGAPAACNVPAAGWADITWLADLHRVTGNGVVASDCLRSVPSALVANRLTLRGGTLKCGMPRTGGNKVEYSKIAYDIAGATGGRYVQSFTDNVWWEADGPVKVTITEFGKTAAEFTRTFAAGGPTTHALMSNLPKPGGPGPFEPEVRHFHSYYQVLATVPTSTPNPIYDAATSAQCGGGPPLVTPGVPPVLMADPGYCIVGMAFSK